MRNAVRTICGVIAMMMLLAGSQMGCQTTPTPVNLSETGKSIVTWGDHHSGQLGDGSTVSNRPYVGALNLAGPWHAVAAGGSHSLALKTDGTVWAWGENGRGQLGIGTTNNVNQPFTTQIDHVVAIAAGGLHSLALKNNGTVWAWGENDDGQLGEGTNNDASSPVQVKAFTLVRAVAIAAGEKHNLAVDGNGDVWAWGKNDFGQLGDSSVVSRSTPVKVKQLTGVVQVAAGATHSLARKSDGSVWAWGDRRHLQLSDGTVPALGWTPIRVLFGLPTSPPNYLSNIVAIAAGGDHNVVLDNGNQILAWGSDKFFESSGYGGGYGTIGPDGTLLSFSFQLQGVPGKIITSAAGTYHSLALTEDGRVWAWGRNDQGQLGDSTLVDGQNIAAVKRLRGAKAIAAGGGHNLALVLPALQLDQTALNFGNVQINNSATLTVIVSNAGIIPVNINSIVISGPAEFSVTPGCVVPVPLAVAASCTLQVAFRPASLGNRTAKILINNDSPLTDLEVALAGNGVQ